MHVVLAGGGARIFFFIFFFRAFGDSYKIVCAFVTPTLRFRFPNMLKKYCNITEMQLEKKCSKSAVKTALLLHFYCKTCRLWFHDCHGNKDAKMILITITNDIQRDSVKSHTFFTKVRNHGTTMVLPWFSTMILYIEGILP